VHRVGKRNLNRFHIFYLQTCLISVDDFLTASESAKSVLRFRPQSTNEPISASIAIYWARSHASQAGPLTENKGPFRNGGAHGPYGSRKKEHTAEAHRGRPNTGQTPFSAGSHDRGRRMNPQISDRDRWGLCQASTCRDTSSIPCPHTPTLSKLSRRYRQ
jgi:hypothetical protein